MTKNTVYTQVLTGINFNNKEVVNFIKLFRDLVEQHGPSVWIENNTGFGGGYNFCCNKEETDFNYEQRLQNESCLKAKLEDSDRKLLELLKSRYE